MQNVSNYMCPFFLENGLPNVAGRVHFVQPDCSAAPLDGEDPDYISIYDADGTELTNPLPLNNKGAFQHQPFVSDGIDFRMIVEAPTGNTFHPWITIAIIDSKAQVYSVTYSGLPTCGSLADLRTTDPAVGQVLVLGYRSADDCCPSRVFKFVEELLSENYGTHVRSTLEGQTDAGTWVCEPSGFVDARWFGLDSTDSTSDNPVPASSILGLCHTAYPDMELFVPAGWYSLDTSINVSKITLERNTFFLPEGDDDVQVIADSIECMGESAFVATESDNPASKRVLPVLSRGTLRTSWLFGTINEFLTSAVLKDLDEIVFDYIANLGSAAVTISHKFIRVLDGITIPNSIKLSDCLVFYGTSGKVEATSFSIAVPNKNMNLDADGLSVSNPTASIIVSATGVSCASNDNLYSFSLDYSKLRFAATNGASEFTHSNINFAASGDKNVNLSGNGLVVSQGAEGSEVQVIVKNYSIESNEGPAPFLKGVQCKWKTKALAGTEIDGTDTAYISDATFTTYDTNRLCVVCPFYNDHMQYYVSITATPTKGRVLKLVSFLNIGNLILSDCAIIVKVGGTIKTILSFGSTAVLVADGSVWSVDYGRS